MLTQVAAGRTYDYSHSVGRGAQSGMGFNQPVAVALGKDHRMYVVNRGSESISNVAWNRTGIGARVSRITVGPTPGDEEFLGEFSKYGNNDGEFIWGSGVAVDRQENVYVSDEWLNQISVFDQDGKFQGRWSALGKDDGLPHGVSNIAIDAQDNLYLTDGRSHEVRKFTTAGQFLASWGGPGTEDGRFNSPWGITTDRQGCVYVADHRNDRVQKFTADGQWLAQFGQSGTGRGGLQSPVGVAVDPEGDVYVCDWSDNGVQPGRVHVFDPEGKFIISLSGDAQQLSRWAQMTVDANADYLKRRREVATTEPEWRFAVPTGLAYDAEQGRLIVVDNQRSRLQIYKKLQNYMVPQMNL
jgi:DNA-binding beta-propeller fold protein YncE